MSDPDWQKVFEVATRDAAREWEAGNEGAGAYGAVHILRALGIDSSIDLDALARDIAATRVYEFGPAAKVFGPVSLHPVVYVFENGERRVQPWYQMLPRGQDTPVIVTREETATNQQTIIERNILGSVPAEASGIRDVLRHLRKQQVIGAVGAAFYHEAEGRHPEQAMDYARWMATATRRERLASEALHELVTQYPADAESPGANMSVAEQEREAGELRRRLAANESLQAYTRAHLRQT